ncbi:hypothetical protein J32TS6_27870 [Virgibacillus pantothenticus]|uniref:DUF1878 domain-containing protein n=1 Tax=Virgibacillus pantothenticus TaxID=1473 RepID=A0A0L0QTM7_VIRPA|nr:MULTISPECIES: DUF1878 family protein [Virgibacillus]API91085.1 hypothetical protein BKP57_03945 [Virgibacillus sp. 6R]KNE21959.1 hypothetical protein AFK71_03925 [Virgibacillus pantothenticus]MBS7429075.1 DUF1878 family protein [Virgibacillus sp. 19R1-5]MBU8566902.1 YhaI family protein [Virgibacillus pantothenticus]MBU8600405.1 YhaI family protein [Virgibacillus pantothenticus]
MKNEAETTAFHLHLLSKIMNMEAYPFTKLIIECDITEQEYNELIRLLDYLDEQFKRQTEEGLLDFSSLLIHFAGMLHEKLELHQTIFALKEEGYYPSLMNAFLAIIEHIKD